MNIKISKKALDDIESIWFFTAENWSVEQADRYYNTIFDEIEYLSVHPMSGRDYSQVRKNYRCSKVKSHLVFYRVNESGNAVEIILVLHQQMDIENRLNE